MAKVKVFSPHPQTYCTADQVPNGTIAVGKAGCPYIVIRDNLGCNRFVSLNTGCQADAHIEARILGKNEKMQLENN